MRKAGLRPSRFDPSIRLYVVIFRRLPMVQCSQCRTTGWLSRLVQGSNKLSTKLDEIYNTWFGRRPEAARLYAAKSLGRPHVQGVPQNACVACGNMQSGDGACLALLRGDFERVRAFVLGEGDVPHGGGAHELAAVALRLLEQMLVEQLAVELVSGEAGLETRADLREVAHGVLGRFAEPHAQAVLLIDRKSVV